MNYAGAGSNVFTGLAIEESSGTSVGSKEATSTADRWGIDSIPTMEVHNTWVPPPDSYHEVNNSSTSTAYVDLESAGMCYDSFDQQNIRPPDSRHIVNIPSTPKTYFDLQPAGMSYGQQDTIDRINFDNVSKDSGAMGIDPVDSKASLQMNLLRQQIEYTKRDILLLELKILEKERSLLLTEQEKTRILQNCESKFINRRDI